MKKLLAMVLCVVMVLSIAPAAFADLPYTGSFQPAPNPANPTAAWPSAAASNKAISNAKKNIEYMYQGFAADNAVFGAVKSMDSFVVDLAKGLFKDVDDYTYEYYDWDPVTHQRTIHKKVTVSNDTLVDNSKLVLRKILGDSISDYMNDHMASYTTVDSHFNVKNGGTTFRLRSVGSTADNQATVFIGDNGWIYTVDADGVLKTANSDTTIMNKVIAATATSTSPMTAAKWATLDPDQKASYATLLKNTDFVVSALSELEVVRDYRYDPIKYADAFATAMSKALASKKGAAGIESYMYAVMQQKVMKDVNDKLKDDFWPAVREWEDGTAILAQYGWSEGTLNPYAFINPNKLPKASMSLGAIDDPDPLTDMTWTWGGTEWIPDF